MSVAAPGLRVVAAVVAHPEGRVGGHQAGALAVHQLPHVVGVGGITAEQAVLPEDPEVTGLRHRLRRRFGREVGVAESLAWWRQVGGELGRVEAGQG